MDAQSQKNLLTSPYAKEFLSELIRKTESYKFNRAVEELRVVSTSIAEAKEILIALTIAVYIIAICYAVTLCLKITRRKTRVHKHSDIESQCGTPPYSQIEISRKTSLDEIIRNGVTFKPDPIINNGFANGSATQERPSSLKRTVFDRNQLTSSSCKRRQTMVQLLENLEKSSDKGSDKVEF